MTTGPATATEREAATTAAVALDDAALADRLELVRMHAPVITPAEHEATLAEAARRLKMRTT